MGRRDDLIATYADDLRNKCGMNPDMDLLTKVTIGCGPAIYDADASTVAAGQAHELETVKNNFLIKKLGLTDGPQLTDEINKELEDALKDFSGDWVRKQKSGKQAEPAAV